MTQRVVWLPLVVLSLLAIADASASSRAEDATAATQEAAAATGQALAEVTGVIYLDANGNGRRDPREQGLAGVKVSNGRDVAVSDARGGYRLPGRERATVFVIKPPAYAVPTGADGLPRFWQHLFPQGSPALKYGGIPAAAVPAQVDFGLLPAMRRGSGSSLEMLVFGDPQPKTRTDVDYYARDIVAPLVGRHGARLGLSVGDIVNDDLSLYPAMNQVTAKLGVPWLHVAGNHDLDFDAQADEDSLLSFRNVYGPDTYAWEEPQASFIVLDDVVYRPGQKPAYIGGLREAQFDFLRQYLATLPKERRVVIAAHIPFFDPLPGVETFRRADRERLFTLLREHTQVLLISAHTHNQRHYRHGADTGWQGAQPLHEYNVGATCGAFWSGVKDAQGIPDTTMSDGTPNGYAWLTIQPDGDYALRYHVARAAGDPAIGLHAPKVLRQGAYPAYGVYANVYMGEADTRVEYRIDGGEWKPMRRVLQADPALLAENIADDTATALRGYDRSPEADTSTHLWRGALPTDLAAGEHRIDVRAFDRWRGEQATSTTYRLQQAAE
ncbi:MULTISPECIES: calcineurin-like phosphoesterase family protein [unclassified Pseudoxanthomonas]|uniref:calcineurin-like phosphoesterase C-terminal domain-containing protein n=1 Tax=unclassified Pseudoxanthomonas TaxID=2645906 RepID=UPI001614957A|nr:MULTISPECIES: calcineurin-like phosphoesterase family protein [unclassified Pseudoxanthomonas]MBB3274683.1 3',5'-cyclic AMP phosphodiesterase CpdA [Pseudoxanthomonas sp. OG2]MBV7475486.1 calcineurin-like phosphoesterase family protein [Pseudoxanthomonas sp. PXM05]